MTREEKEKLIMQGRKENGWEGLGWFKSLNSLDDEQINILYNMYKSNGTVTS